MEATIALSPIKMARREKILDAALRVFAEQGFRGATMEGIAAAVGMSKATVYSYFSDKDAVFAAVARRFNTGLEDEFRRNIQTNEPLEQLIGNAFVSKVQDMLSCSAVFAPRVGTVCRQQ